MVAKLSRENANRKGLEVFDSLPAIGLMPDTAITNAAISACDKGPPPAPPAPPPPFLPKSTNKQRGFLVLTTRVARLARSSLR